MIEHSKSNFSLVVDANGLYSRSYYAAETSQDLSMDHKGPIVAAFNALFSAIKHEIGKPEKILFAFDGKPKTNKPRKPKPLLYYSLMADFSEALQAAFGKDSCTLFPENEADDVVATAAFNENQLGRRVVVMSGDKDLMQLKNSQTSYYCLNRKHLIEDSFLYDKWSVRTPIHVALALAIIGDPGDGINGVDKMGKKAVDRVFETVTADDSFERAVEKITDKMSEHQKTQFYESLDYTLLHTDIPGVPSPVQFNMADPQELSSHAQYAEDRVLDVYTRAYYALNLDKVAAEVDEWQP